jgi:Uncharacterized protein conserved in bacteria (DUF2334)
MTANVKARYLVRFDDLCPTMNWDVWDEVEHAMIEADVRPILAVIPDNQDASLMLSAPREGFWARVRGWQSRGWTIGLHGHQHLYTSSDRGLFGWNERSEFAGLDYDVQLEKLERGTAIFREQGVVPQVWVAPNHAFDRATVAALLACGVDVVSDGLAVFPYRDRAGTLWVPMQTWGFAPKPPGVWTVCLHHNGWTSTDVSAFRRDLEVYGSLMTSFDAILERYGERTRSVADRLFLAQRRMKRSVREKQRRLSRALLPTR